MRNIILVSLQMCLFCILYGSAVYSDTLYKLDFSNASGNAESWFEKQGWEFKENMEDMKPRFENGAFVVESNEDDLGLVLIEFERWMRRAKLSLVS